MNNGKIKITVVKSITALVCCLAVAAAGSSITNKVCESKEKVAEISANASGASSDSGASSSDGGYYDDGTGSGTPTDDGGNNTDGGADAGTDAGTGTDAGSSSDGGSGSSSSGNSGSSSGSSSGNSGSTNITATSGLNSSNKAEVLKYYQLVAAKNEKKTYTTKMTLQSLDGGSGFVGSVISAVKPIAESALEKNSNESDHVPGQYLKIKESDWKSATATNDGTYTTLNIQIVPQTDGPNGQTYEGTVGRSIGVLNGVQTAIDEMGGVSADFENGKVSLVYDNAYIKVKVKNSTGEFVKGSGEWHFKVTANLDVLAVKVIGLPANLKGAKGVIDFSVKN